eukprot:428306_1
MTSNNRTMINDNLRFSNLENYFAIMTSMNAPLLTNNTSIVYGSIVNSGYLKHKSLYLKQIRKRWILLTTQYIYCYKENKSELTDTIDLNIYNIITPKNNASFQFELKSHHKHQKAFTFIATSIEERNTWITNIKNTINNRTNDNIPTTDTNHLHLQILKDHATNSCESTEDGYETKYNEPEIIIITYTQYLKKYQISEWSNFYVNYKTHKQFIIDFNVDADDDTDIIQQKIRQEIIKVDEFFTVQLKLCDM